MVPSSGESAKVPNPAITVSNKCNQPCKSQNHAEIGRHKTMANNELNIPVALYDRLRNVVGADDGSVRAFALAVIQREVELLESKTHGERQQKDAGEENQQLTMAEWQARRQGRPVLHIDFDAAAAIHDERERQEQEWLGRMES